MKKKSRDRTEEAMARIDQTLLVAGAKMTPARLVELAAEAAERAEKRRQK